jgi:hypothetical protein
LYSTPEAQADLERLALDQDDSPCYDNIYERPWQQYGIHYIRAAPIADAPATDAVLECVSD